MQSQNPTYRGGAIPAWLEEGIGVCAEQDKQWRETKQRQREIDSSVDEALQVALGKKGGRVTYDSTAARR